MGALEAEDAGYAAFEVEALALVHPWPDDAAAFAHAGFLADSYRRRGYPLLLVSATVVDHRYLRGLLDALEVDDVLVVRLTAPVEVLRERIIDREPSDWVGLPRLVQAIETLADSIASLPGVDLVMDTAGADPRSIAGNIRQSLLPFHR